MALKKSMTLSGKSTIKTEFGIYRAGDSSVSLDDCYIKVEEVSGTKQQVNFSVSFDAANETGLYRKYSFVPALADESKNFIAQAYEYLKTLPEFDGAVDC